MGVLDNGQANVMDNTSAATETTVWTRVNLSTGTENNTGQRGGSNSLGSSSTIDVAAAHGRLDAGMDGYNVMVDIGAKPSGARQLSVKLAVGTAPTSNGTGGYTELLALLGVAATPASSNGYMHGFNMQSNNTLRTTTQPKFGTGASNSSVISGNPLTTVMTVNINSDDRPVDAIASGQGGSSGEGFATQTSNTGADPAGNIFVGVGVGISSASPGAGITWTGVTLDYVWLS